MRDIDVLEEWSWIKKAEPLWWDLDYPKDPREFMGFDEFESRLKTVGRYPLSHRSQPRDINIYTEDTVPISTLDIEIKNQPITLFVTVRPFTYEEGAHHFTEVSYKDWSYINGKEPGERQDMIEDSLIRCLEKHESWFCDAGRIPFMFLPHARGFFKERRGNRVFYYPLGKSSFKFMWEREIPKALEKTGKDYLIAFGPYTYTHIQGYDRIRQASDELMERKVIAVVKNPNPRVTGYPAGLIPMSIRIDWPGLEQVVYDDFTPGGDDMASYYPTRVDGMEETIALAITTRTHPHGKKKDPYVPGIFEYFADVNLPYITQPRIIVVPFTDEDFARHAARAVSEELGHEFKGIVYERRPGRCRYRVLD